MNLTFEKFSDCLSAIEVLDSGLADRPARNPFVLLKDIRSFERWTVVPLSGLNIVTGPNSSGKSTLLEIISKLNRNEFQANIERFAEAKKRKCCIGFSIDASSIAELRDDPDFFNNSVSWLYIRDIAENFHINTKKSQVEARRFTLIAESEGDEWPLDIYIFLDKTCIGFARLDGGIDGLGCRLYMKLSEVVWRSFYEDKFANEISEQLSCLPRPIKPKIHLNKELVGSALSNIDWIVLEIGEATTSFFLDGPIVQFDKYLDNPEVAAFALICIHIAFIKPFYRIEKYSGAILPGIRPVSTPAELTFKYQAGQKNGQTLANIQEVSSNTAKAFSRLAEDLARNELGLHAFTSGKKSVQEVNEWLERVMGSTHKLSYRKLVSIRKDKRHPWSRRNNWRGMHYVEVEVEFFLTDDSKRELTLSEVGTGVSQLLPVISSIIGGENKLYSQPELHLHPKAQAILGDLFIVGIQKNREKNQKHPGLPIYGITLETHSEHLILRILRRIREDQAAGDQLKLSKDELSIIYLDSSDGKAHLHWIRVDKNGEFLDVWPNGFFIDRFEDIVFN